MSTLTLTSTVLVAACGPAPPPQTPAGGVQQQVVALPPQLPAAEGWGIHALVGRRSPAGDIWVGSFGHGMFRLPSGERTWEHVGADPAQDTALVSSHINSLAFQGDSIIWYGTVGSGFGASADGGRTWRSWRGQRLGSQWRFVTHDGIRTRGDTVFIATTDGLRITADGGSTWRCVQGVVAPGAEAPAADAAADGCTERLAVLPSKYLLSIALGPRGTVWLGHLDGLSVSRDGGRTWTAASVEDGEGPGRVRAVAVGADSVLWAAGERGIFVDSTGAGTLRPANVRVPGFPELPGRVRAIVPGPGGLGPAFATSFGLAAADAQRTYRLYYLSAGELYRPVADVWNMTWLGPPAWPLGAAGSGIGRVLAGEMPPAGPPRPASVSTATQPARAWLGRPVADEAANPYADASHLFGTTRAGEAPVRFGTAFNNPAGVAFRSIAAGEVVFAGSAQAGGNTVAVRHEAQADGAFVYSVYRNARSLTVQQGARVAAGDVLGTVGSSGGATHEHLLLEVHVTAAAGPAAIVAGGPDANATAVNPQLWIEPRAGTGVVAGRVVAADGQPVPGARVYGLVLPYPDETPFSFAETYAAGVPADPAFGENFVVGDVPAGSYSVGVDINGTRVWRRVIVAPGQVTFVSFTP